MNKTYIYFPFYRNIKINLKNFQMNNLEKNYNKLHGEVTIVKYMLLISIMLTVTIAILMAYVLKMDSSLDSQQNCHVQCHHEI